MRRKMLRKWLRILRFAVIYAENAEVVATYDSEHEASSKLAEFVAAHPKLQDEIGLREYDSGRPVGDRMRASEVLHGDIAQPHLV